MNVGRAGGDVADGGKAAVLAGDGVDPASVDVMGPDGRGRRVQVKVKTIPIHGSPVGTAYGGRGTGVVRETAGCRMHGTTRLVPGTTMCADSDCVTRWVTAFSLRSTFLKRGWQVLADRCLQDDYVAALLEKGIVRWREGRPMKVTAQFLAYDVATFIRSKKWTGGREVLRGLSAHRPRGTDDREADVLEFEDEDELFGYEVALALGYEEGEGSVFSRAHSRAMMEKALEVGGAVTLMVLRGDLSVTDAWLMDEAKRKAGQTLRQRALETEVAVWWMRLWAGYSDGGRDAGYGRGRDKRWDGTGPWFAGYDFGEEEKVQGAQPGGHAAEASEGGGG